MRNFINKYGAYIVAAAIVATCFALYFYLHKKPGTVVSSSVAFYVDEDTQEESVRSAAEYPPLAGKDNKPTVVMAFKVSCDGGKTSRIAYLEKYTPEAQQQLQTLPPDDLQRNSLMQDGLLIRLPEAGSPWVPGNGPEGVKIRDNIECPPGQTLTIVVPH